MVAVPALMWTPFPQNKLRIVVTIVSAGLIYIGGFYQCYYLKWPVPVVVSVIAILCTSSAVLSRQLLRDESTAKISRRGLVNYESINPNDAAWNRSCEVLTRAAFRCFKPDFNYSVILQELKPDIVFVLTRAMTSKKIVNNKIPLVEDKIFKDYMIRMSEMEKIAKKIYVLQALPTCRKGCLRKAMAFTKDGRFLRSINEDLIRRDDFFARLRIAELGKRCKKCEIIDYKPVLVDDRGHYLGYDPKTNLMFLDGINHFNRFGKERIQTVYNRLVKEFELSHI
ncbi:hypothetical protein ANCDUO_22481 [Ancylostoma duodenale]|uniref:SGNH domain-containing protein n=1 Tax=Ancylostoma duodenale TaxID=51022 RepID=A0A0C2BU54_9BILA|nr:hypothetical protein ANCDUO_22481 [Ancylostoma duodenale]